MNSKINIIAIGDPHLAIDVAVPAGRHPESFFQEQINKLNFIKEYILQLQEPIYLVVPGDLLSYKTPSLYTAQSINSLIKALKPISDTAPIFSIAGNHDLKFCSRDLKEESVYHIFTKSGILTDIHSNTTNLESNTTITGLDFNSNVNNLMQEIGQINESLSKDKTNILVIHEHLLPDGESIPFGIFKNYSDFTKFKNIDIIISGHLHKGYPTQYVEVLDESTLETSHKILFVNPWSLTRLARDNYSLDHSHKPELVHLTISESKEITFNHIEIPHLSPDQAFIKDSLADESKQEININEFVSSLYSVKQETSELNEESLSQNIKDKIHYYLEQAEVIK